MVFEYTEEMFVRDKKEMLEWLDKNWIWKSEQSTYLSNMLSAIKDLVEAWKRE